MRGPCPPHLQGSWRVLGDGLHDWQSLQLLSGLPGNAQHLQCLQVWVWQETSGGVESFCIGNAVLTGWCMLTAAPLLPCPHCCLVIA